MNKIIKVNIEDEMKSSYIDYSMSVIVSRALPDVRDGFKPVHRRVLFGMLEMGVFSNRPYKKSARIVGEVLGKYHPHGDSSIYFAMVRMAQEWSLRYPLVDGQGNFGSIDGDSPAAMRYTEAKLKKIAEEMMNDINKDTVDMTLNFDDTLREPTVLPTKIPTLLLNGSSGIAVGMATNMAPHNLTDVLNATLEYIDNNDVDIEVLINHIKAPDFPSGGIVHLSDESKKAYTKGKGKVIIRGKTEVELLPSGREQLIITEIPYMVVKSEMIKRIADIVNQKRVEGISDIRDESDRKGMRVVIELKKGTNTKVLLNNLYKHSQLQTSFSINNIALVNGRPKLLNLKEIIECFVKHRNEVIIRRSKFDLANAEKKLHILEGYLIALANIDEVIETIKKSKSPVEANEELIKKFELTKEQAKAILELRLQRLTGMEVEKIKKEHEDIIKLISELKDLIDNKDIRKDYIKNELVEIRDKYGDKRKSEISYISEELNIEDMIPNEEMVVTISHQGYIKRTPLNKIRVQSRGGVGSKSADTKEKDWVENVFTATNHEYLLIFTEFGKCYWLRVYEIPEAGKNAKGRPIQNLINIAPNDNVKVFLNVKSLSDQDYLNNNYVLMCTKKGIIKKSSLIHYSKPRVNGIIAINVDEKDVLYSALLTNGSNEVLIGARSGKATRFDETQVRSMGRTARGVKGIEMDSSDEVIGICVTEPNDKDKTILVVSENGYSKRSTITDYRITKRGGKGVKAMKINKKTGTLISLKSVSNDDDLMIINKSGTTIRVNVSQFKVSNRVTQGSKVINIKDTDSISSVEIISRNEIESPEQTIF